MRATRNTSENPGATRFARGAIIQEVGSAGSAWRVVSGALRLDAREGQDGELAFAGLAVQGDIVGAETLMFGDCYFRATALTPIELEPWPGGVAAQTALLNALAASEKRTARIIALRGGEAAQRIKGLLQILAAGKRGYLEPMQFALPTLRDMADITALTVETVSRIVNRLSRSGILALAGERRGRSPATMATLIVNPHELAMRKS